jgi:hypothetical protein
VLLEGNVRLHYDRDGHKAQVMAQRVLVSLTGGQIIVEGVRLGAAEKAAEQSAIFSFWTDFSR